MCPQRFLVPASQAQPWDADVSKHEHSCEPFVTRTQYKRRSVQREDAERERRGRRPYTALRAYGGEDGDMGDTLTSWGGEAAVQLVDARTLAFASGYNALVRRAGTLARGHIFGSGAKSARRGAS